MNRAVGIALIAGSVLGCGSSSPVVSGAGGAGASGAAGASAGTSGSAGGDGAAGTGAAGTGAAGTGTAGSAVAGAGGASAGSGGTTAGAAGHDAGAGDAPVGGSAGAGGGSACGAGKYLLCESFESTAVGAIPAGWTRDGDAKLVGVDDKQAARGAHALELGAASNGPRRIVHAATTFGAGFWGRIYYKIQTPAPKIDGYLHSTMVALTGLNPQGAGSEELRVVDTVEDPTGKNQFLYNVQPQGKEFGTGSAYDYMYDNAWHCAEWHIDATDQSYHFYLDGTELTKIAKTNGAGNLVGTGIPQVFQTIEVGWNNYQVIDPGPGFVAWIDEIAVDKARVGCAN